MTTNVTTPVLYGAGTVTTVFSLAVILLALATIAVLRKRRARRLAGLTPGLTQSRASVCAGRRRRFPDDAPMRRWHPCCG